MTFKIVTIGGTCEEHGDFEVIYIVPDHVSGDDIMFDPDPEIICQVYDQDNADMIVAALNRQARH